MNLKHYVTFVYPGAFVSESSDMPVDRRDVRPPIPERALGYFFWSRYEMECQGETLIGPKRFVGQTTYFGKEYTLAEVKALGDHDKRILISNMECNGWKRVVHAKGGQWFPLQSNDQVEAL